jgi:hypothetical protein
MKKEVRIIVGNLGLCAFGAQCVNVIGPSRKLELIAFDVCPDFHLVSFEKEVIELWFYRDFMIFRDWDDYLGYCVPVFHLGTCRFSSLKSAKSAISRFLNKKGGAK